MTQGDLVSRVVNGLRALNHDQHVSRRYILNIAKSKSRFYIAQKLRENTLYRDSSLQTEIKCFKLEESNSIECGVYEFNRCESLMKSVKKLPELIYTKFGGSILRITNIDYSEEIFPLSLKNYSRNKKRPYYKLLPSKKYYYEQDGYIYLPDSNIKAINVFLISTDSEAIQELNENCEDCDESVDGCQSAWDLPFVNPDKLENLIISDTINEVFSTYARRTVDEHPNLDENIRSSNIL